MSNEDKYCRVLEFAIEKEVDSYLAYTVLAGRMVNKGMRGLFMAMAGDELGHKANLELELMKRGRVVREYPLAAVVEDAVAMEDGSGVIDMEYKEAILLAVEKEDAAFRLYAELAVTNDDAEARSMFFAMAEQEMIHKMRFQEEYENIIRDGM